MVGLQENSGLDGSGSSSQQAAEDKLWGRRRVVPLRGAEAGVAEERLLSAAVTPLSDLRPQPLVWLWGNVLAQGKITLLTGPAGVGKSFVAMEMAAAITRPVSFPVTPTREVGRADAAQTGAIGDVVGSFNTSESLSRTGDHQSNIAVDESVDPMSAGNSFHDTTEFTSGEHRAAGDVLLICSEHELADVVRPRLQAANADLTRVHAVRGLKRTGHADCRLFQLNDDLQTLERELAKRAAEGNRVRLVVVDPFPLELSYDRTAVSRMREVIRNLSEIAAWAETAILLVTESDGNSRGWFTRIDKALESSVQSVWTIVPDLHHAERRLLLSMKSNWIGRASGRAFQLRQGAVEWEDCSVNVVAEQHLRELRTRSRDPTWELEWSELGRAKEFLQRRLAGGKPMPLQQIKQIADANDISFSTLRRAFCGLRGKSERIGVTRLWMWSLPESDSSAAHLPERFRWPSPEEWRAKLERPDDG